MFDRIVPITDFYDYYFKVITKYDEERTLAEFREEGREEGRAEGLVEGREEGIEIGTLRTLTELVNKGLLSLAAVADTAHMSVAEFESKTGLS